MSLHIQSFTLSGAPARLPVLISVPHAAHAYSAALLDAARLPASALGVLEDPLVDRLIQGGVTAGAAAIVAAAPRAEIDLNRSLDDLDPAMVSPAPASMAVSRRASAGLGLIPSRVAGRGAIWRDALPMAEVERRIADIYLAYHDALAAELSRLRDRFGIAVLLDCHSMPPRGRHLPGVVFGDRHGASADALFVSAAESVCAAHGLRSTRNDPYAGGEIVARHGRPAAGVHAFQIEIDRGLYLAPGLRSAGAGFGRISAFIAALVENVSEATIPASLSLAAE